MPRAEQRTFARLMTQYILSLGRPKNRDRPQTGRDYEIDTPLGPLGVSFSGSPKEQEENARLGIESLSYDTVHVHCCFEYPRVAHAVLGDAVNPHSGKWNFYYGKGSSGRDAFEDWKGCLARVLRVRWVAD